MKNILHWFGEGQTHFVTPRGATMSCALNEPNQVALYLNSNTTFKHTPQVERND